MINTILFDADGTLIDSETFIVAAFQHSLQTHNQPMIDELKKKLGPSLEEIYKIFAPDINDHTEIMSTHRAFQRERKDMLDLVITYPMALELLTDLNDHKLGIVTNRSTSIAPTLEHLDLSEHFDIVVDGTVVNEMKPSPIGILHALEVLNRTPDEAVMIGDTIYDIQAGKAAGVTTIAITHGTGDEPDLLAEKPDYLIHSLHEVQGIIDLFNA
jgi:HAD superfamily hydrolase (TIGR01509 family)